MRQDPHEVIVVINGPRNEGLEQLCDEAGVLWEHIPVAGKRPAVRLGIERSSGEITVLVQALFLAPRKAVRGSDMDYEELSVVFSGGEGGSPYDPFSPFGAGVSG